MAEHCLECLPEHFDATDRGDKTHEIRKDHGGYRVGDVLILERWDPATRDYTGQSIRRRVTYVDQNDDLGCPSGYCIMSLGMDAGA